MLTPIRIVISVLALLPLATVAIPVLSSEPRHSSVAVGGIQHLARMTDKAQLSQDGKLGGELQYPCPNDEKLLNSLGVQSSTFSEVVKRSKSDDEVLTFLKATVGESKLDSLRSASSMRFKEQLRGPSGHKHHGIPHNIWKNYVGDGVDGC